MITLPPELRAQLRTNHDARRMADVASRRFDPSPVVKFFNPLSAATWLATELDRTATLSSACRPRLRMSGTRAVQPFGIEGDLHAL